MSKKQNAATTSVHSELPEVTEVQDIAIERITPKRELQARERTDSSTVENYAERLAAGDIFPPVILYTVNPNAEVPEFFVGDGVHRFLAHKKAGLATIRAIVHTVKKPEQEALWSSCTANTAHGLPRSTKDKQRAIRLALTIKGKMSDRSIAKALAVDGKTVANVRAAMAEEGNQEVATTERETARGHTVETSNIKGNARKSQKTRKTSEAPDEEDDPETGTSRYAGRSMLGYEFDDNGQPRGLVNPPPVGSLEADPLEELRRAQEGLPPGGPNQAIVPFKKARVKSLKKSGTIEMVQELIRNLVVNVEVCPEIVPILERAEYLLLACGINPYPQVDVTGAEAESAGLVAPDELHTVGPVPEYGYLPE